RGGVGPWRRRHGEPELTEGRGGLGGTSRGDERLPHAQARTRSFGVIGEALEEAAPERGGTDVVPRARGLGGGEGGRGGHGPALGGGAGGRLRRGARGGDVAQASQAVRLLQQRVLRDGRGDGARLAELARGLGPVCRAIEGHGGREALPRLRREPHGG